MAEGQTQTVAPPEAPGDPVGPVPALAPLDDSVLVDKVQAGLDQLDGTEAPTEPSGSETGDTEVGEGSDVDITSGQDSESSEAGEAAAGETAPTLPDAYRRSLRAYDWTNEEIDTALTQDPNAVQGFIATAGKIHANRNAELAQWASMGRQQREHEAQPEPAQVVPAPAPQLPAPQPELTGEEGLAQDPAVQQALAQLTAGQAQIQAELAALQTVRNDMFGQQMDTFFIAENMKPFSELYGPSFRGATQVQTENRNKVMLTADDLMAGSQVAGRPLQLDDALRVAHESVSKDFQETAIRRDLKDKVTKRGKSLTLKPGHKTQSESSAPKTEAEMEAKVAQNLQKVFG